MTAGQQSLAQSTCTSLPKPQQKTLVIIYNLSLHCKHFSNFIWHSLLLLSLWKSYQSPSWKINSAPPKSMQILYLIIKIFLIKYCQYNSLIFNPTALRSLYKYIILWTWWEVSLLFSELPFSKGLFSPSSKPTPLSCKTQLLPKSLACPLF